MEKWQNYRLEIDQSSQVGQTIVSQGQLIEDYKKAIDRINPAILQGIKEVDLNMHKGVSEVVVSQKQISNQIINMFRTLNKAKTVENRNNISTILFNLKEQNILKDDKHLKETWLTSNTDYAQLSKYVNEANQDINKNKEFEKNLQDKFKSVSSAKTETVINDIAPLTKNGQKNIGHHVFVIAIAIALVFFLLILALLFIEWFA